MLRENKNFTGNDRFEGFCIDLLRRIASQIGFQYTIRLVPDHMYGVYDRQTKQWNGIVRELMERVSRIRLVYYLSRRVSVASEWNRLSGRGEKRGLRGWIGGHAGEANYLQFFFDKLSPSFCAAIASPRTGALQFVHPFTTTFTPLLHLTAHESLHFNHIGY